MVYGKITHDEIQKKLFKSYNLNLFTLNNKLRFENI